jgi:hypothetical protein
MIEEEIGRCNKERDGISMWKWRREEKEGVGNGPSIDYWNRMRIVRRLGRVVSSFSGSFFNILSIS